MSCPGIPGPLYVHLEWHSSYIRPQPWAVPGKGVVTALPLVYLEMTVLSEAGLRGFPQEAAGVGSGAGGPDKEAGGMKRP